MGADADILLDWMTSAAPSEMNFKVSDDLCRANIATFVYHGC